MDTAVKLTETGGFLYNFLGIIFAITIGILFVIISYHFAYQDPIDQNKRNNKITITFLVFILFIVGITLIIGGIQYLILINSDVGYMVNTATGIGSVKNIVTNSFRG